MRRRPLLVACGIAVVAALGVVAAVALASGGGGSGVPR
jgi:hypothetical protein